MKRTGSLQRHTPLRRGCRPLPTFSPRRKAQRPERDAVREAVFSRDGYRCRLRAHMSHHCSGVLTVHHLRKASAGGAYDLTNLIALCAGGNVAVEDNPTVSRAYGLVQRPGDTTEDVWRWLYEAGLSSSPEPGSAP